jgi:hypothetical protein
MSLQIDGLKILCIHAAEQLEIKLTSTAHSSNLKNHYACMYVCMYICVRVCVRARACGGGLSMYQKNWFWFWFWFSIFLLVRREFQKFEYQISESSLYLGIYIKWPADAMKQQIKWVGKEI